MTDEKYVFMSDSFDKKRIARGAFNKRTHTGRGGKMKMPSDYLTRKEREAMNGECISYRLNEPMKWAEFLAMPRDIQKAYIQALRDRFGASDSKIFEMLGVNQRKGSYHIRDVLGIGRGRSAKCLPFNQEAWEKWRTGIKDSKPMAVLEEVLKNMQETAEEAESALDEATEAVKTLAELPCEKKRLYPTKGHMSLCGTPADIAEVISSFLGEGVIHCDVSWAVVEG